MASRRRLHTRQKEQAEQQLFGPDDGGTKDGQAGASGDGIESARKPSGYDNGYDSMDDFIERTTTSPPTTNRTAARSVLGLR